MDKFSENVKFLRKKNSLTQPEIKKEIGIEPTTWSNYERGKSYPNLKLFCEIAKFFEVPETELLHASLEKRDLYELNKKYRYQNRLNSNIKEVDGEYLSLKDDLITILKKQIQVMEKNLSDKEKIIGYLEERLAEAGET